MITGEGIWYDLGSMSFWVLLAFGGTVAIGYYAVRAKQKQKTFYKNQTNQ